MHGKITGGAGNYLCNFTVFESFLNGFYINERIVTSCDRGSISLRRFVHVDVYIFVTYLTLRRNENCYSFARYLKVQIYSAMICKIFKAECVILNG